MKEQFCNGTIWPGNFRIQVKPEKTLSPEELRWGVVPKNVLVILERKVELEERRLAGMGKKEYTGELKRLNDWENKLVGTPRETTTDILISVLYDIRLESQQVKNKRNKQLEPQRFEKFKKEVSGLDDDSIVERVLKEKNVDDIRRKTAIYENQSDI